jgi:outer membrane protein, heavy metal efflux system
MWMFSKDTATMDSLSGRSPIGSAGAALMIVLLGIGLFLSPGALCQDLRLDDLVQEALKNSPDILASQARIEAARHRIPQSRSLPDPMVMFGYQNEGFDRYSYGQEQGSQWMFSASQLFPFPGKRPLKGEMAERDRESLEAMHELLKLKTAARVKELYFDLFLVYKNIDLLKNKGELLVRIEDLTLARYGTGKAMQQEVLMAQTEKYMLLEKEEMYRQKIRSVEAMIRATIGRNTGPPLGRPADPAYQPLTLTLDETLQLADRHSPEIRARNKMIDGANTRLLMARKDYFPDFTINASYFNRSGDFKDMWSTTATMNIPLYYKTRQEPAVAEARANLAQARQELEAVKLMIAAAIRDNFSMIGSADKLMDLYKNGLIPKNTQDFELALTGYATGRVDAPVVISRLKTLLDYEALYWGQFTERAKALARLHAIAEGLNAGGEGAKE